MKQLTDSQDVLHYWFGEQDPGFHYLKSRSDLWFRNGKQYDQEIKKRFGSLHHLASACKLDHWQQQASERLALIIILDQFSRHLYRETPRAFAQDTQAQSIVLEGIHCGHDRQLKPVQRVFFYLPLEHAEDKALQKICVEQFEMLINALPADIQPEYASTLNFARRHKEVIDRFGRFPDLNAILGRRSTAEEIEFLTKPGASFL